MCGVWCCILIQPGGRHLGALGEGLRMRGPARFSARAVRHRLRRRQLGSLLCLPGGAGAGVCHRGGALLVQRCGGRLRPSWRPFGLRSTYVASVLVKKYRDATAAPRRPHHAPALWQARVGVLRALTRAPAPASGARAPAVATISGPLQRPRSDRTISAS
jgi:hypothetical protein